MPQVLKKEIKERIVNAALKVFSNKGLYESTIAEIARESGTSVGNIYHYYSSKEELYYSIITPALIQRFKQLISSKLTTAKGIPLKAVRSYKPMNLKDDDLQSFFGEYRLHLIAVLDKGKGTRYEGLRNEIIHMLINNVNEYIKSMRGITEINMTPHKNELLTVIYANLFQAVLEILKTNNAIQQIAEAYQNLLEYHFFGISKFIG